MTIANPTIQLSREVIRLHTKIADLQQMMNVYDRKATEVGLKLVELIHTYTDKKSELDALLAVGQKETT